MTTIPSRQVPLVVIAGASGWADEISSLLAGHEFDLHVVGDLAVYLDTLIDRHAALVLVAARGENWSRWVSIPKTEQAMRRIPVLVIAPSESVRAEALRAGADAVLLAGELSTHLLEAVRSRARVPDAATLAALEEACAGPLPPLAQEGIARFNAGEYYRQHDLFEALWMAETGPVRDLYRAILQVGVAYHHITQGNLRGALRMLRRSVQWMTLLPDVCQGVDVATLRADAARVRQALEARDPVSASPFPLDLLRPVRLVVDE